MAYIKKEPIVEFITKGLNNPDQTKAYGYDAIEILAEIEYAPTVDAVKVVRCKDCIYYNSNCCFNRQWDLESAKEVPFVRENDFCSYGEKALKERER